MGIKKSEKDKFQKAQEKCAAEILLALEKLSTSCFALSDEIFDRVHDKSEDWQDYDVGQKVSEYANSIETLACELQGSGSLRDRIEMDIEDKINDIVEGE